MSNLRNNTHCFSRFSYHVTKLCRMLVLRYFYVTALNVMPCTHVASNLVVNELRLDVRIACDDMQ